MNLKAEAVIPAALFGAALALYASTLAPGLVFGDPSEYTFVPYVWGIAHPPGYAFQTVLGGLWMRLLPFSDVAYRANLLSAALGAGVVTLVYGCVHTLTRHAAHPAITYGASVLAALSAASAPDLWQHSIHANAHITTAFLMLLSLYLLLRWASTAPRDDRWLYGFCVVAGLSVSHHPLTVFSFPAYTAYILAQPGAIFGLKPGPPLHWRRLLIMLGCGLAGLLPWAYLPLRASLPTPLIFGPTDTNTLEGFLNLVLARGLTVNLFQFGLADQPDRATVFFTLLSLQAPLVIITLMPLGLVDVWRRRWREGLLLSVFFGVNLLFIMNTIQDVMAYLNGPFAAAMILAGLGLAAALDYALQQNKDEAVHWLWVPVMLLIGLTVGQAWREAPLISLRSFTAAEDWAAEVYARFEGEGEGAYLLAHWEHLTPLWYAQWVEGRPLAPQDVTLVFVAANSANPWLDNVQAVIEEGPVYVSGYQRALVEAGYRLRPVGQRMYQVLPAPALSQPRLDHTPEVGAGPLTFTGYDLPLTRVQAGQRVPLSLAFRLDDGPMDEIVFPYVAFGDSLIAYPTDSHLLTPGWQPGEVIVERYDFYTSFDAAPGTYPLRLGLRSLTTGQHISFADGSQFYALGEIEIIAAEGDAPPTDDLMANIANQVGLIGARARLGTQTRMAVWAQPLAARPGDALHLTLRWRALNPPDENWKVFVHLVGADSQLLAQRDAPPLGGAFPTYLWFPKWVPGQQVLDPYRLIIPADAPPGLYSVQIGLYGFETSRRAHFYDPAGNLSGDHFILGSVEVQ